MSRKTVIFFVVFAMMIASANADTCGAPGLALRSRCPNQCGQMFTNYNLQPCQANGPCGYYESVMVCCGAYPNYADTGSACWTVKYQNKREALIELASLGNFLVPGCDGAYVPARSVLKTLEMNGNAHR